MADVPEWLSEYPREYLILLGRGLLTEQEAIDIAEANIARCKAWDLAHPEVLVEIARGAPAPRSSGA
jgi:hypothetical protein